jgi:hypothetical protein
MSTENTFNIYHYSDGMTRKYGNETNLEIEDAVENLSKLETMKSDFRIGERWYEIEVSKNTPRHAE